MPKDASRQVDFLDSQLRPVHRIHTERGLRARHRGEKSDPRSERIFGRLGRLWRLLCGRRWRLLSDWRWRLLSGRRGSLLSGWRWRLLSGWGWRLGGGRRRSSRELWLRRLSSWLLLTARERKGHDDGEGKKGRPLHGAKCREASVRATELFEKGRTKKLPLLARKTRSTSPAYLEIADVALDGESGNTSLIVCP